MLKVATNRGKIKAKIDVKLKLGLERVGWIR
jgi:hypothetical protein